MGGSRPSAVGPPVTPAGKLQKYLRERVEALGGHYRKVKWEGRVGCPDCYVWFEHGIYAWIEIKAGDDRLAELQKREHERMRDGGLRIYTAKTEADIDRILSELMSAEASFYV